MGELYVAIGIIAIVALFCFAFFSLYQTRDKKKEKEREEVAKKAKEKREERAKEKARGFKPPPLSAKPKTKKKKKKKPKEEQKEEPKEIPVEPVAVEEEKPAAEDDHFSMDDFGAELGLEPMDDNEAKPDDNEDEMDLGLSDIAEFVPPEGEELESDMDDMISDDDFDLDVGGAEPEQKPAPEQEFETDEDEEVDLSLDDLKTEKRDRSQAQMTEDEPEPEPDLDFEDDDEEEIHIEDLQEHVMEQEPAEDLEMEQEEEDSLPDDEIEESQTEDLIDIVLKESHNDGPSEGTTYREINMDDLERDLTDLESESQYSDDDLDIDRDIDLDTDNLDLLDGDSALEELMDVEIPDLDEDMLEDDEAIDKVLQDLEEKSDVGEEEEAEQETAEGIFGSEWISEVMDEAKKDKSPATKSQKMKKAKPVVDEKQKRINKARRLARNIAIDIKNYNQEKLKNGLATGNIMSELKKEILEGKAYYQKQVKKSVKNPLRYYYEGLVHVLANGDKSMISFDELK